MTGEVIVASLLRSHFLAIFPTNHFSAAIPPLPPRPELNGTCSRKTVLQKRFFYICKPKFVTCITCNVTCNTCNENLHVKTSTHTIQTRPARESGKKHTISYNTPRNQTSDYVFQKSQSTGNCKATSKLPFSKIQGPETSKLLFSGISGRKRG